MNPEWQARYEKALEVAHRGAQLALDYFDGAFTVEWKSDQSPVTVADREAEHLIRVSLREAFPHDGFLGEEFGDSPGSSGYRWILDPIDGTRSFVRGIPLWGTLVGLEYKGERIAGVCDAPALGQTFHALRGEGVYRNDRRIRVSEESDLKKSLVFYSGISWFMAVGKENEFLDLVRRTDRQRGFGDFYGFMLVAQGSGELMVEHGVHAWDVAAIQPIVEEAGGRFSNWDGGIDLYKPDVLVSNGRMHDEVLKILAGAQKG
jgi:histidinol-phosphatase